jgi:hypothetical protein
MPSISMLSAPAGGGRFTPLKPTLSYAGSGLTNMGKFTVTNYDSTFTYTATGGSIAGSTFTVTASTGSGTLTARAPKGLTASTAVTAFRQAPTQSFIATGPVQCYYSPSCASQCGGCGTFYPAGGWGPGEPAGFYACCAPGYFAYDNYAGSGFTWGGTDYTNGQGEWWKIV